MKSARAHHPINIADRTPRAHRELAKSQQQAAQQARHSKQGGVHPTQRFQVDEFTVRFFFMVSENMFRPPPRVTWHPAHSRAVLESPINPKHHGNKTQEEHQSLPTAQHAHI